MTDGRTDGPSSEVLRTEKTVGPFSVPPIGSPKKCSLTNENPSGKMLNQWQRTLRETLTNGVLSGRRREGGWGRGKMRGKEMPIKKGNIPYREIESEREKERNRESSSVLY